MTSAAVTAFCPVGGHERLNMISIVFISVFHFRSPQTSIIKLVWWLDIYQVNSFHVGKFMYKYQNRLLPSIFLDLFQTSSQIHNYNTRSATSLRPRKCRTNIKQFSVLFQGPQIWNALPSTLTSSTSLFSFSKKFKSFLLKK